MQTDGRTDRRTEIACTLIIIIRGGYNTILCIGSAHCFVPFFVVLFPTPRIHGGLSSLARVVCMKRILSQSLILFLPF